MPNLAFVGVILFFCGADLGSDFDWGLIPILEPVLGLILVVGLISRLILMLSRALPPDEIV